ncbi:TerC family protein [Peribacillus frigoritolerans]|uniref:TerC family protein n=1 Tax=Peribacillus frigoritolerans TaxID=450367 RepID=UPI00207A6D70|nr:TerC family protein [Peribacillus frigoritolerans]USK78296.1 TerC family protein [Peribacillus frigoritolerans]WJE45624.1 TerC family protein [Peribacillus frigoritolerans]
MSELLNNIVQTYAQFFDWHMWVEVLSDPVSWGLIGTLVLMEGLLSADNALVLAVMVRHLPEKQRKKALFYGLLGAYAFRFIAIGIGVFLIKLWWVKVIGAAYLGWLSFKYFRDKRKKQAGIDEDIQGMNKNSILIRMFGTLWGTVAAVELMDIAFSVDSVLAAFGVSEKVWVLLTGGMIGVLMMRGVAGVFLKLIDKVPELETAAYVLIGFIAIKMLMAVAGIEIPPAIFFALILLIFGTTIVYHLKKGKKVKEHG